MTPEDLYAELASTTLRPAYLLAGEEALLRDDTLAALRRVVLDGAPEDFNLVKLAGDSTSPAALNDALAELPVMAAHRLVILSAPDARRAGAKALLESLADAVAAHVDRSRERVETVLVIAASKPDKRQRWVKAFGKQPAAIVSCDAPKNTRDVASFIKAEAKLQGVKFEKGAAERLADLVGPQLLLLRQEVGKAALIAGPDTAVTRAHIEESTSQLAEEPIWDLTDAIGEGRTRDAIALLGRMSDAPAPVVLGALAAHFRKLTKVRHGGGVPGPPFVKRKLENQARRFSPARLRACLTAIHECDLAIKGASPLPPALTLERLVLGLAL